MKAQPGRKERKENRRDSWLNQVSSLWSCRDPVHTFSRLTGKRLVGLDSI